MNRFLLRAQSVQQAGKAQDLSYAERVVKRNQERVISDPDCADSHAKVRRWAAKLEKQRKSKP